MRNWGRFIYQPVLPMGKDGTRITGSKEHIALSREAAREGMVLLKNEHDVLPVPAGKKVALFGKGSTDYVKGRRRKRRCDRRLCAQPAGRDEGKRSRRKGRSLCTSGGLL